MSVQAQIFAYAEAIGWTVVSQEEAEQRRGFDQDVPISDRAKNRSLFLDDLLDCKIRLGATKTTRTSSADCTA